MDQLNVQRAVSITVAKRPSGVLTTQTWIARRRRVPPSALATLHRRRGPRVRLIAPDGFLPVSALFVHAGNSAARAAWVLRLGIPEERLTARGRRFVAEFGATQPQRQVDQAAVYAAEATEVLLDAIARSDGTRRSVAAQLRDGRPRDGLIGRFRLARAGRRGAWAGHRRAAARAGRLAAAPVARRRARGDGHLATRAADPLTTPALHTWVASGTWSPPPSPT